MMCFMEDDKVEDDKQAWPPPPTAFPQVSEPHVPKSPRPNFVIILIMWACTVGQFILQATGGLNFFTQLLGFAGFLMALFLVTRREKAARVNGGLRLLVAFLGFLVHLLNSR